jgi:ornithine cyclodeaminase/alanine dehydrogenase-like protein (mu-crystallin family)
MDGIRYLPRDEVAAAMPPLEEQLDLAERALTALVGDAELPPKIGVHPRPEGSFAHAMPASSRPSAPGASDLLGLKWVTGFPANRAAGIAPINAVVILNDPLTGLPTAILDGGPITAQRTAAVSGVVLRHWTPAVGGRRIRVAIIGAGVQGHSHLAVVGHVLPGCSVVVHDRHPERAAALVERALATPGIGGAEVALTAREATMAADVVITAVTFARPEDRQPMTLDWLAPGATVVAVDYAAMCSAAVARDASLFLTDDIGQFLANRDAGQFDGFPEPQASIGSAILSGTSRPAAPARVVAVPLGIGLADLVFADAIDQQATAAGLGTILAR